jgi:sulfite reductase (NADPH) flavoprotein alpha-component
MSLLKQRQQLGYSQNWLIFGERQQSVDYFYQTQLEAWHQEGHLQHLDLAFSRDQEQRIYVQHLVLEHAERLKQWIADGAVIYVCGSIEGMASGVDQALTEILGEESMTILREESRYRRDVY